MVATAPDVCSEETARVTCSAGGRNPLDSTMAAPTVISAGGNNFAEPRAAGPTTRTNAKNSQDIREKTGEHTSEPLLQPFYPDTQDDQGHDNPEGVVYLLTATKIPAGHRKMVHTKICGKPDSTLLLFTPTYSHDSLSLADAAIEGGNELCAMLMVENSGTTSRYLRAGTELGTVSPAEEVKFQTFELFVLLGV